MNRLVLLYYPPLDLVDVSHCDACTAYVPMQIFTSLEVSSSSSLQFDHGLAYHWCMMRVLYKEQFPRQIIKVAVDLRDDV